MPTVSRPNETEVIEILEQEDVSILEMDLRTLSLADLEEHFGAESSGRIVISRVLKSIIWQAVTKIKSGEVEGIYGNLRTFFYQWVKPVVGRIPGALDAKRDPYDTMLDIFVEFVGKYKLFRYADLELEDENWPYRMIGKKYPQVIVFSEKTGFFSFLRRIHRELDITVASLGGTPSLMSTEFLIRDLYKHVRPETEFTAFSIVDWDPSGYQIANAQIRQFRLLGLQNIHHYELITPEVFTPEEIAIYKYPIPTKQKSKNQRWLETTGGVNGTLYGLESDSLSRKRLKDILYKAVEPYVSV